MIKQKHPDTLTQTDTQLLIYTQSTVNLHPFH